VLSKRPDVVYVYHPPATVGVPALVGRFFLGVPVVYDIQDLWPDSVSATQMVKSRFLLRLLDRWCGFLYRSVDRIVVLSPGFRQALIERGVNAEKIDVIYNWCDEKALCDTGAPPFSLGDARDFKILFAGTMGLAQALDPVLEAARICATTVPNARFVFVGGGIECDRLQRRTAELSLGNVTFIPRQPMSAMGSILAGADALLVHLKDDPLFRITIPSKTQAYLAAGKPIIMGVRGDAADLVLRAGAGLICEPENPESIAGAVARLASLDSDRRAEMGSAGRNFYWRELSLSAGVDRFEAVFRAA
jgi:glycosyltransferase involved in cell wall biosynthesis